MFMEVHRALRSVVDPSWEGRVAEGFELND